MDWKGWIKGLIHAVIGGVVNDVVMVIADPAHFNLYASDGRRLLMVTAGTSGFVALMMYLKQSPIPPDVPVRLVP